MAKSIKELKKENAFLKGKCDKTDVTLIELAEEVMLSLSLLTLFKERKLLVCLWLLIPIVCCLQVMMQNWCSRQIKEH